MGKSLPRGIRNHNPGNVDRTKDRWLGMAADQSGDPRFIVFDTPEAGLRCLMRLLITYQEHHGLDTLRGVIERWAPKKENNTGAYVQHVARLTGFDPDERLDFLDRHINLALTRAIVRHENGPPEQYGRRQWYDDATYDRAAVMAGFEPSVKPLTRSRTVAGGVLAAAGAVGAAVSVATGAPVVEATAVPVTPDDVAAVAAAAGALLGPSALAYISPIATLLGVALSIYARWDDARRKLR